MKSLEEEKLTRKIDVLEELKIKVRPKIFVVKKELADLSSIFKKFDDKNQEDGKPVLTKTIGFY